MRSSDAIIFITKMIGQAITVQAGTPMTVQGDGAGKVQTLLALLLIRRTWLRLFRAARGSSRGH
jgi:hypothetical protein